MNIELDQLQQKAINELDNGKILKGGVGSGKSRTSIAYYYTRVCGGSIRINGEGDVGPMATPKDLYIFTTAKKRNDLDWQKEAARFALSTDRDKSYGGVQVTVDSWNNLPNYTEIKNAFVIFDEQRLVGSGAWVKAFYKIAKHNQWILLSATPGDNWLDYIPVFVANGYYKNRTEFIRRHVVYNNHTNFPKVDRYVEERVLWKLKKRLIIEMPYIPHTTRHIQTIPVDHDVELFEKVMKKRWHIFEDRPIRDVSEMFALMRKMVNIDQSRLDAIISLQAKHPRLIIFYNFNYELELLRKLGDELGITYAEWNGHKHEAVPESQSWLYLVQYTAGAEAWECTTTDSIVFYSLNYSYKINEQARGRIDRRNTPYTDLYYYVLRSNSWIDQQIWKSILKKKNFNERDYKLAA